MPFVAFLAGLALVVAAAWWWARPCARIRRSLDGARRAFARGALHAALDELHRAFAIDADGADAAALLLQVLDLEAETLHRLGLDPERYTAEGKRALRRVAAAGAGPIDPAWLQLARQGLDAGRTSPLRS